MAAYVEQVWANGAGGLTPVDSARLAHMEDGIGAAEVALEPSGVKTANYTTPGFELVRYNTTASAYTLTLPTAPADRTRVAARIDTLGVGHFLTIAAGGSDKFGSTSGATTMTLQWVDECVVLEYRAAESIWIFESHSYSRSSIVPSTRQVASGTGLTGGGDLSTDRTLAVTYGSSAGTAAQGNDTRVVNAVQTNRQVFAGDGLTGGGDLSSDRTISVAPPAGYLAANFDPLFVGTTSTLATSGVLHMLQVPVPNAITVNNLVIVITTAGSSLTSGQNLIGLYDSTGTKLQATADQTTAWGTTGIKTASITAQALPVGICWIGILTVGTTVPAFGRGNGQTLPTLPNGTATGASLRWATSGSSLTALPASVTLSGMAALGNTPWVGLQ